MMSSLSAGCLFLRRLNADGTMDSICLECFRPVANKVEEDDLESFEHEHICVSEDASQWDQSRRRLDR
jgi:hypothetical protein